MRIPVEPYLVAASLAVAVAIFALDTLFESHDAAVIGYVGLVLVSWRSTWPAFPIWLGVAATALIIVAYFIDASQFSIMDVVERCLAVAVMWPVVLLCSRQIRNTNRLEATRARLHRQEDEAASALLSERNDRERVEEELEEAEHRYRGFFNQTFQLVAVLQPSGMVEELNETMLGIIPSGAREIVGVEVWDLPLWSDAGREHLRSAVAAAASGNFFRNEFRIKPASGDEMIVDLSLKPVRSGLGQVDLIILEARDITQHVREHALLMQAQKMEVLGRFASGITHDFNNLLTVIAGNLELVERRTRDDESVTARIERALNAVFHGRDLTDRILTFARKQQLEPRPVDCRALIGEVLDLAKSGLDEDTFVDSSVAPDLWPCWADSAQLQTALLNLIINARDAMPNGGRVTVRASNVVLPLEGYEGRPDLKDGDYVALSVADEGEGIPADIVEKVTEPFFSTKGPGEGSGLGLSMVHGFAKQSGGDLMISSAEGEGTTVSLYLPRSLQPVEARMQNGDAVPCFGDKRILVVEDDPEVRATAASMLSDLGYGVEATSNSDAALGLLHDGRKVDLLLTDVVMPGEKDGWELGRCARSILPDIKILYSSAHSHKATDIGALRTSHEDFIPKPYHYAELARKTQRLLSGKVGDG
jgi:PAS domain S-box-containing protein